MIHDVHRPSFFPRKNSPISSRGTCTHYWKGEKVGRNWAPTWADITSWSQVGVDMLLALLTVPAFISYSSPPVLLPTLHFSEPFCHSRSTLSLCPPPPPPHRSNSRTAELPLGFAGPRSSKAISHSGIEWTKSLEASDRGALAAKVTNSRTF